MFVKVISLLLALISASRAFPTVDIANQPQLQPHLLPQARTFGSLFGTGATSYRYPDAYRGYGYSGAGYPGAGYSSGVYAANPVAVQQASYPTGYGGYGWRGNSDYRGYGQSGWANRGGSGWSNNYGR